MTTAHELVAAARSYLGVRFAHQGRSDAGLDCLGLLLLSAEKAGLRFGGLSALALDVPHYGTRPDSVLLGSKLGDYLVAVHVAQPGDILLLAIDGRPQHLALVSDYPAKGMLGMIHAYAATRKVVEHAYDAHWQAATRQIFRLPQLETKAGLHADEIIEFAGA
ncbi:MAG: NlpC/P60 family protein [Rickettsiales bacterium]